MHVSWNCDCDPDRMSLQMTVPSCASIESFTRSVPLAMAQHQPVTPMISCFILLMLLPLGQNSSPSAEVSSCSSAEDLTVCLDKLRQAVAIRLCRWLRGRSAQKTCPSMDQLCAKKGCQTAGVAGDSCGVFAHPTSNPSW